MTKTIKDKIAEVALYLIDEPKVVDRIEISNKAVTELAVSISEIGLLQPILLRKDGERFEVIAGHRRFLAHKLLGLKVIKAVIRVMTDQEAALARATENLGRVNLTPVEEAVVYYNLVKVYNLSYEEIGKKFGKSPGLIRRRQDLLKMPLQLKNAVHSGQISISVAEELWPITDIPTLDYYLSFALEGGCTALVARQWCKDWRDSCRRKDADVGEGSQVFAPSEPRPIYVSCDLCVGPMVVGQETVLRVCQTCFKTIKENM